MPEALRKYDFSGIGLMNRCPERKREFLVADGTQWVYKRGNKNLCSYSCTRKYDERTKGARKHNYVKTRR